MSSPQSLLKSLRANPALNLAATTTARAAGFRSEWVIRHLHRMGDVSDRLPNGRTLRLWSRGDDWVSNQVYWRGWTGYEPETTPLWFGMAQRARVTLDVGAYVGFYSLLAGHANPEGRVFAFEPLPSIFERLRRHAALNVLANLECVRAAVSDREGEAEFFHVASALPTSSSLSSEFMSVHDGLSRTRVRTLTLDGFLAERGVTGVDLMKIDTESTEPEVLRGMRETLARDRPAILCEVLAGRATGRALREVLDPLGYRYYLLTPEGPREDPSLAGHAEWLNYLFTVLEPGDLRP